MRHGQQRRNWALWCRSLSHQWTAQGLDPEARISATLGLSAQAELLWPVTEAPDNFQLVVETLRAWTPEPDEFCWIEAVEEAVVDGQSGLIVLWSQSTSDQGVRAFGLIATADEIVRVALTNDGEFQLSDLHLMLVEPHGTAADNRTRTWFRSADGFIA
jgi:hypothetical protein